MSTSRRVTRSGDRPAYRQLADILREQIISGELAPGAELPSEATIAAEHRVSRTTVTQAMGVLRAEGLVVSERGRLSRVRPVRTLAERRYAAGNGDYGGDGAPEFAEEHGVPWPAYDTERSYRVIPALPQVARLLGVAADAEVVERRWIHSVDGVALRVSWSYLDAVAMAGTALVDPDATVAPGGTIAQLRSAGHDVIRVRTDVGARLATDVERDVLRLPAGAWVLESWRVQHTAAGPVECAQHVYPAGTQRLVFDTAVPPAPPTAGDWVGPAPD